MTCTTAISDLGLEKLRHLRQILKASGPAVVACSGGLDSLLLAVLAHREFPERTLIAHGVSPAVPREAVARLDDFAVREGWRVERIVTGEFDDAQYLENPVHRCYFCKKHLYATLNRYGYDPGSSAYGVLDGKAAERWKRYPVFSGANVDDLGEYRPGLDAAREAGVRHPFIEAAITKNGIREICRYLDLPIAALAASPCLASRIYTGTPVDARWLGLIDSVESRLKALTGVSVVRCRMKGKSFLVETREEDRPRFTDEIIETLRNEICAQYPEIESFAMDPQPYKPGRAFVTHL